MGNQLTLRKYRVPNAINQHQRQFVRILLSITNSIHKFAAIASSHDFLLQHAIHWKANNDSSCESEQSQGILFPPTSDGIQKFSHFDIFGMFFDDARCWGYRLIIQKFLHKVMVSHNIIYAITIFTFLIAINNKKPLWY